MNKSDIKNPKICINCGFLNEPSATKCKNCGQGLLVEPADPMQTIRSETNFLIVMAKGNYEKRPYKIALALLIGVGMLLPALFFGIILLSGLEELGTNSIMGLGILLVLSIFAIIGLIIIYKAIGKIFENSKRI